MANTYNTFFNPFTQLRTREKEANMWKAQLHEFESMHYMVVRQSEQSLKNALIDAELLMQILRDVRPHVKPGKLDTIVRKHVVRRGLSPVTTGLLDLIRDTRERSFIPIRKEDGDNNNTKKRAPNPVINCLTERSGEEDYGDSRAHSPTWPENVEYSECF